METIPVQKSEDKPCCEIHAGETLTSDNANELGTSTASVVLESVAFRIWGAFGLVGVTILIINAGIVSGLEPEVFWQQVLSNLAFAGKNVWSILP